MLFGNVQMITSEAEMRRGGGVRTKSEGGGKRERERRKKRAKER